MATWASYTEEQKTMVRSFLLDQTAIQAERARLGNHQVSQNTQWNAQVASLVNGLDAAEVIDNIGSGLSGASNELSKEDTITLVSHLQADMLNDTQSHRDVWVKLIGPTQLNG